MRSYTTMSERKVLVIDLDGTICEQTSGGTAYRDAKPVDVVIDRLRVLRRAGWKIVIHTARGMRSWIAQTPEETYGQMTRDWLLRHRVPYDELVFGKPAGDLYVDDKGASIAEFLAREVD